MSFTINEFDNDEWHRHRLADFGDFADQISECNMGEDSFSGFGEWFYVPGEPLPNGDRVIYFGSWGNDNSPGASDYTNAEIFDCLDDDHLAEFSKRVEQWDEQPEFAEGLQNCDQPWDEMLAQQELEDFEQVDEYFGFCDEGDC